MGELVVDYFIEIFSFDKDLVIGVFEIVLVVVVFFVEGGMVEDERLECLGVEV